MMTQSSVALQGDPEGDILTVFHRRMFHILPLSPSGYAYVSLHRSICAHEYRAQRESKRSKKVTVEHCSF